MKRPAIWIIAGMIFVILCVGFFDGKSTVYDAYIGKTVRITGVVETLPTRHRQQVRFVLGKPVINGERIHGKVMTSVSCFGRKGYLKTLQPGDIVRTEGALTLPNGRRNPGGFDYRRYLKSRGISAQIYVPYKHKVTIAGQWYSPIFSILKLRKSLTAACNQYFNQRVAHLLTGILFGDLQGDTQLRETFADAGIAHVLAVSGLHVGYLCVAVWWLFKAMGRKEAQVMAMTAVAVGFYIVLTGFAVSVVRAAIMLMIPFWGRITKRHVDRLSALCVAAMIILAVAPYQLWSVSFQMSFGAVLGIILLYRPLVYRVTRGLDIRSRCGKWLVQSIGLTIAATIGTLPATLYYFQTVNVIGLVGNLLVVPLVGILLILAFVVIPFLMVFPELAQVMVILPSLLAKFIFALTDRLRALAFFNFHGGALSLAAFLLIVMFALLAAGYFNLRHYRQVMVVSIGLPLLIFLTLLPGWLPQGLKITYLDVGQGDAALIETPAGGAYLIDGGGYEDRIPGENAERTPISEQMLLPALYSKGITHLDGAFISHNHADHAQGIEELAWKIPIDKIYVSTKYNGWLRRQKKIPVAVLAQGDDLKTKDGLQVAVLWPERNIEAVPDDQQNEVSMILRLQYGRRSFLFTGDAGIETEPRLDPQAIDVDVLKVGHHGSASATSAAFLKSVTPVIAVISVGQHNWYGHPTSAVLKRIRRSGAQCYRTDQNGAVELTTNGKALKIKTYE